MMLAADLEDWANVSQIVGGVGVLAALAALVVAWIQLRKTRNATRGQMILAVDQALAPYDDIRNEARNPEWQPPPNDDADGERTKHRHRIKQYMGVWERVEHLLADKSIDPSTVNDLYGQRVENLLRNHVVRDYLIDKPTDWETFIAFASRLATRRPQMKECVDEVKRMVGSE
jgi:hypothetical protein